MAELTVKYRLDADSLLVKDLVSERDFLAQRLGVPEHLLQVLSWGHGSMVIMYWIVRDVLPLAELALCREVVREELTQHGVEAVYLNSHPSEHSDPVSYIRTRSIVCTVWKAMAPLTPSMQVDQSLQSVHCKETQNTPVMCDLL